MRAGRSLFTAVLALLLCISFFAGCGQQAAAVPTVPAATAVSSSGPTAVPTPEPTPSPTPLPVVELQLTDGKVIDPYRLYDSKKVAHDVLSLGQLYHESITVMSIGQTNFENEIYAFRLGKGSTNVLITATTHARENVTTNYILRAAENLAIAYRNSASVGGYDIRNLLDKYSVYICPCNNPDGLDICNLYAEPVGVGGKITDWTKLTWKANGMGNDLNRNFPFQWQEMVSSEDDFKEPSKMNYPGPYPASEPETQALMGLVNSVRFEFDINLHTKGRIVYWRDPVNGTVPGDEKLASLLGKKLDFEVAGVTQSVGNYGGGFENWFRSVTGKPGVCLEMTTGGEGEVPYNHPARGRDTDNEVYDIYSERVLDWQRSESLIPYILTEYFSE